ncbi:MAG: OadG family protein [Prolixibacteraceae bacterium]
MNSNFEIALELLGIGMITVFLILFLVVFLGNVIIQFVNRFLPEAQSVIIPKSQVSASEIGAGKMAAIVAAVQAVTDGKGKVVKIEKV